ncbi:glycosyltransferase [Porphyrobacter sp. AAP60]|uniref:glycosyltransferase n=1 Tax=Porphyrobacter sp. AAP60 TaxID=1523423 RepID=UPI0006B96EA7|nr:glycosyltransferase [Porphyrobacter sp. AAP60]KPF63276.1 hypothetical protein IP79_10325 [Porphyrobacter sp. AAP60]
MKYQLRQKMKIVLIGYIHGRGGIQTHTWFLAEGLRERGHAVEIVSPPPMVTHGHDGALHGVFVYSGLRDLVRALRGFGPDVVVVAGTGWGAMLGALAVGKDCRKVFFEVMSGARPSRLDPRLLSRFGFDAIIGQGSPVTRRFVREFGWHGHAETIPALPEPLERQFTIPVRVPDPIVQGIRFVYFGRLAPSKNVRLLIEEFDQFAGTGTQLDIWGDGSDAGLLARMIAERGLNHRIKLRGRYPDGQAYISLLRSYDLLLLPTVAEEGAPLVLLEAMACGLPFVANGMGGITDYANADCAITNGSIRDFVPAVKTLVARLESGDIDHARLQRHYATNFGFDTLTDRWESFLCQIVG